MEGNLVIPIKIKVYIPFDPAFILLEICTSYVFTHVQINVLSYLYHRFATVEKQKFGNKYPSIVN